MFKKQKYQGQPQVQWVVTGHTKQKDIKHDIKPEWGESKNTVLLECMWTYTPSSLKQAAGETDGNMWASR